MVKTQAHTCSHGKVLFASKRPDSQGIANSIIEADGSNQSVLVTNTQVRGRPFWQPVRGKR